jgi:hypothetical protein
VIGEMLCRMPVCWIHAVIGFASFLENQASRSRPCAFVHLFVTTLERDVDFRETVKSHSWLECALFKNASNSSVERMVTQSNPSNPYTPKLPLRFFCSDRLHAVIRCSSIMATCDLPTLTNAPFGLFATLPHGTVASVPDIFGGGSAVQARGVQQVYFTNFACAALKSDESVVTWGHIEYGGDMSDAVRAQLARGVKEISSTLGAFAALKFDGSVVTWGHENYGGDSDDVSHLLNGGEQCRVTALYSTNFAFAALRENGSVVAWGGHLYGGRTGAKAPQLTSGVTDIIRGGCAFAAVKSDGYVVTWGGGFFRDHGLTMELMDGLRISSAVGNDVSFAAILDDGSLLMWGQNVRQSRLPGDIAVDIFHTDTAFAAVLRDGSVVTWGHRDYGGSSRGRGAVREQLDGRRPRVTDIVSTNSAFAALRENGSVVTWGNGDDGGNSDGVRDQLADGVLYIVATGAAFAAVKMDGAVVTWGNPELGGRVSPHRSSLLQSGVLKIVGGQQAVCFAAVVRGRFRPQIVYWP